MGKILAICISEKKGAQKKPIESARLVEEWGIEGDANVGKWHRQVSMLSFEKIEAFREKGADVDFGAFGENLVVEVGLRQGYVLESHVLQHVLHIVLRFRARMYEIAVVMRQVANHVTAVFRVFLMLFCKIKDNFLYTCPLVPVSCRAEQRTWVCLQYGAEIRAYSGCDFEN